MSGLGVVSVIAGLVLPRQFLRPSPASSTPAGARPTSTATLTIRQPAAGEDVEGAQVEVVMELAGGRVIDSPSSAITPDTGHIHLALDGEIVSMTYGVVQLVDLTGRAPGSHTLRAEFVAADHGSFDPPVVATVRFTTTGATMLRPEAFSRDQFITDKTVFGGDRTFFFRATARDGTVLVASFQRSI